MGLAMTWTIDINCDMGESFGAWSMGGDAAVLPLVTSANVACGFHAGDPSVMLSTVKAALALGVAVGAHPGLPDLQGFGRREMAVTPEEAYGFILYQIGALAAVAKAAGGRLAHVKPHGALYNRAARDLGIAQAIAAAVRDFDPSLILVGLSGSRILEAARDAGLKGASEVFADRAYEPDGSLTPRSRPGALVVDEEEAAARVARMVLEGKVRSTAGSDVEVRADTVCLHGDHPGAPAFARRLRRALEAAGIEVRRLA